MLHVLTISDTINLLRGRFHRCRYMRDEQDYTMIAKDIGIPRITLYRFGKGGPANAESLAKIEEWCEREEQAHATIQG